MQNISRPKQTHVSDSSMITDLMAAACSGLKVTSGASGRSRQREPQLQHHIVLVLPEQQELQLSLHLWGYTVHTSVHEVTDLQPRSNMNSFPLTVRYLFSGHTAHDCDPATMRG